MARLVGQRKLRVPSNEGIVSFTFDDVPRSACKTGAAILEAAGARGTYFVCGAFDGHEDEQEFFRADDLLKLHDAGHEIGSHGFAHLDYQSQPLAKVRSDIAANDEYLASIGLPRARSFAYPFGCVNPGVKRVCAERFTSSRGVEHKGNHRVADLNLLKSVRLYSGLVNQADLAAAFDKAEHEGGWLVFMTHAVSKRPGEYDCAPELLEQAVSEATGRQMPILPVSSVVARLGGEVRS